MLEEYPAEAFVTVCGTVYSGSSHALTAQAHEVY
jgi:hypothetical protein